MHTQQVSRYPIAVVGATGGVGSALARHYDEIGQPIHLIGRDQQRLTSLSSTLSNPATTAVINGVGPSAIAEAVASGGQQLAGIVNCAGSLLLKPAHRTSDEEWAHLLAANLDSAFGCVQCAPNVVEHGAIVLVASAAGAIGLANHDAIACAKAGIQGLVRSAAATYAKRQVRVNAVAPGLTETPLTESITGNPAMHKASAKMHALGRTGKAEEVAAAIAFLLSDQAAWITGQVLGVDGGLGQVRSAG